MLKNKPEDNGEAFEMIRKQFDDRAGELNKQAENCTKKMTNAFVFCEDVFLEGQEMLILVTELTVNYYTVFFISRYGCDKYFQHNKELLFYNTQVKIINELENIGFGDGSSGQKWS